jgi:hypothetical protein
MTDTKTTAAPTPAKEAPSSEPAKNPVPDVASTKPVSASATSIKDPDEKKSPEPAEKPAELTKDEEKELENILDGDDEAEPAESPEDFALVRDKIRRLMQGISENTPDSHTVWGAAGVVLTLGDIRTIAKYMR